MYKDRIGPVLIALPLGRDAVLAAELIKEAGMVVKICESLSELTRQITADTAVVLLGEEALVYSGMDDFVQKLHEQGTWSDLPILLLNGVKVSGSQRFAAHALLRDTSIVTLLDRPLRKVTLISSVQAAMSARQRQWQVQDLLEQREKSEIELRTAKHEAESANRAKDDFLAALSHELRTPLTPALMTVATLRNEKSLPAEVRTDLAMVERNITLEARLIDDLLDLTRISRGKLPLRPEACDTHSLLAHAVEIVRDDAHSKNITLTIAAKAAQSGLVVDAARFQQVVWNLLKNAVKFTPSGGDVHVATSNENDHLILAVSDNGIGFEPSKSEKIFKPFEQAGSESHSFGGLGLGLAISRAIVEMHGGTIVAESDGRGKGAMFKVELPGATEPPQYQVRDTLAAEDGESDKVAVLRILLVEDHEPTLDVLKKLLRRDGHHVTTANSLAMVVEKVAGKQGYDMLISDLGLPDGTGIDVIKQIRQRHPDLPGILLSGYGTEDDLSRSREAGYQTHLIKPVVFQQLQRAISAMGRDVGH